MIKGLSGSSGVSVQGGNTSVPYVNQNTNNPITGMIRVWGSDMQVFDGTAWITMSTSYATVTLDNDAQGLLEWARRERTRQQERERKMKANPALVKAFEAVQRAEENFDLLYKFVEHDNQHGEMAESAGP